MPIAHSSPRRCTRSRRRAFFSARIMAAIAMVAVLSGCDNGPGIASAPPASTSTSSLPPTSTGLVPGFECPVTLPAMFDPPLGVEPDVLFGAAAAYGNGQLWVGGLGEDGIIAQTPGVDGVIDRKLGWWRLAEGRLQITADGSTRLLRRCAPMSRTAMGPAGSRPVGCCSRPRAAGRSRGGSARPPSRLSPWSSAVDDVYRHRAMVTSMISACGTSIQSGRRNQSADRSSSLPSPAVEPRAWTPRRRLQERRPGEGVHRRHRR